MRLAGLFLALPALAATGLLDCAHRVYGQLPAGFYGLDAMLVEGVVRCLAGEPRAEGATRIDPFALGRVLGLDRAPEVKTIRRKIGWLAAPGQGRRSCWSRWRSITWPATSVEAAGVVLYVDGHVRAYQGTRKIAKTHAARLQFPAPATVETWVSDGRGDPVLVVMAEPAASLAGELRRLLPTLRAAVGDDRRVLVGFDRGGWSPALFAHMAAAGFDILTWRKQPAPDIDPVLFTEVNVTDDTGLVHTWQAADTDGRPARRRPRWHLRDAAGHPADRHQDRHPASPCGHHPHRPARRGAAVPDGIAVAAGELLPLRPHALRPRRPRQLHRHRRRPRPDGAQPRQEDHPRHRQHRPGPPRPGPSRHRRPAARLAHPTSPDHQCVLTNADHNRITADLRDAEQALDTAQTANAATPARLPLAQVNPGQQVLDTETKLVTHAIRIAAFNTITSLARDLRVHTGYARAADEAHTLISQALQQSGDIIPGDDTLTIRLDPLPTRRATTALTELCEHLTATHTRYPGTDLMLRYETKTRP